MFIEFQQNFIVLLRNETIIHSILKFMTHSKRTIKHILLTYRYLKYYLISIMGKSGVLYTYLQFSKRSLTD